MPFSYYTLIQKGQTMIENDIGDTKDIWVNLGGILDNAHNQLKPIFSLPNGAIHKHRKIMGWTHCKRCGYSVDRFYFSSKEEFDDYCRDNPLCPWCKNTVEFAHEQDDEIMPDSKFGVDFSE